MVQPNMNLFLLKTSTGVIPAGSGGGTDMCSNTWLSLAPSSQFPLHLCLCAHMCVSLSGSDSSFCFQKAAASTKCSGMMLAPKERCVSSQWKMPEKEASGAWRGFSKRSLVGSGFSSLLLCKC